MAELEMKSRMLTAKTSRGPMRAASETDSEVLTPDASPEPSANESRHTELEESEGQYDENHVENVEVEQDEVPPAAPVDVRQGFKKLVTQYGHKFTGALSASHFYESAPNPYLHVEGVGLVGIPLSEAMITQIFSKHSKSGNSARKRKSNQHNTSDGAKVTFDNPLWAVWISREVVPHVCETLGINTTKVAPKAELHKLVVFQSDSRSELLKSSAAIEDSIATIFITLPSRFIGGRVQLMHGNRTRLIDTTSSYVTHVAGWPAFVDHTVNCVESGQRLVLCYNLLQKPASLITELSNMTAEYRKLRQLFCSWKETSKPLNLAYVLEYNYSEDDMRKSALRGKDSHVVSAIREVAEPLDFHLCIVSLEMHTQGYGDHNNRGPWGERYLDGDSTLTLHKAFDFNGQVLELSKDLRLKDYELVPDALANQPPDDSDYEGDSRSDSGYVELWHRRTILLMWPDCHHLAIGVKDVGKYAEDQIGSSSSKPPTKNELQTAERLIQWLREHRDHPAASTVVHIVTRAAVRWEDHQVWINGCKGAGVHRNLDILGLPVILEDIQCLGIVELSSFILEAIRANNQDRGRFDLVAGLANLIKGTKNKPLTTWVKGLRSNVLSSLREVDGRVIPDIIDAVREQGPDFMRSTILPQLKELRPTALYLHEFITAVRSSKKLASSTIVRQVIKELVADLLSNSEPFPRTQHRVTGKKRLTQPTGPATYQHFSHLIEKPNIDAWFEVVKLGLEAEVNLTVFIQRMESEWQTPPNSSSHGSAHKKPWISDKFLPVAIDRIISWSQTTTSPVAPGHSLLQPFWAMVLDCYISTTDKNSEQFFVALRWCGGFEIVKHRLLPNIEKLCGTSPISMQKLATQVVTKANDNLDDINDPSLSLLATAMESIMAIHMPLSSQPNKLPEASYLLSTIRTFLACTFEMALKEFLHRLMQYKPTAGARTNHLIGCLLPLMRATIKVLQNSGLEQTSQPFSEFFVFCVVEATQSLGPRPRTIVPLSELQSLGCTCAECQFLRNFATSAQSNISITADMVTHVTTQLKGKATSWGFRSEIISNAVLKNQRHNSWKTRPTSLRLTKPATIVAQMTWVGNRDAILIALNSIGSLKVQQQVLGAEWVEVCTHLRIDPAVATNYPDSFHKRQIKQPQASVHHSDLDTTAVWLTSGPISGSNTSRPRKRALSEVNDEGQEVIDAPDAKRRKASAPIPEIIDLSD